MNDQTDPQLLRAYAEHRADATNRLSGLLAENSQLKSNASRTELLRLRGEVAVLENAAKDPTAISAKAWLARVNELKQRLEETPGA